jgi:hypothetical protein
MNFCYLIILIYNELINFMQILHFIASVILIYMVIYYIFNYFCKCNIINDIDYDSDSDTEEEDSPKVFIRRLRRDSE